MASSKYIKAPMSSDIRRYTEEELRKIEVSIASFMAPPEWIDVTFQNGWVNYGIGGHQNVQYYKDFRGQVHVRGLAKNGTINLSIFTLPIGYRPPGIIIFAQAGNGGAVEAYARVDVNTDGTVVLRPSPGPVTNAYIGLNFSFQTV